MRYRQSSSFFGGLTVKRSLLLVLCLVFAGIAGNLMADPCALVTNPADMRFIELKEMAKFLEEDLDMGKGITEVIGKKVIDQRFRKAGIPDPVKESVSYSMVVREMPVDQLNAAFVLKGPVNTAKFLEFADKRYYRYFATLQKQNIEAKPKIPVNTRISDKPTRAYPFAFRNSEALITSFEDYTIIATVPQGDYSLITGIIAVLDGNTAFSQQQPERISFMSSFVPLAEERQEIRTFEGQHQGFIAKARAGFKKVTNKKAYAGEKRMLELESSLKNTMAGVERFSYSVEASNKDNGYAYDISMIFKCANQQEAGKLRDHLLAWMASTSAKTMSEQDMVSFRANRVTASKDTCVFSVKLGSSAAEQYQFSSMIMTLMMQDRRFNKLFKS